MPSAAEVMVEPATRVGVEVGMAVFVGGWDVGEAGGGGVFVAGGWAVGTGAVASAVGPAVGATVAWLAHLTTTKAIRPTAMTPTIHHHTGTVTGRGYVAGGYTAGG